MDNEKQDIPEWLSRQEALIGAKAILHLKKSRVLLAGAGGVGGFIAEGLIRAGIGAIFVVDRDIVDITNINRQIIADTETIGLGKAELIVKRAKKINPEIEAEGEMIFISPENAGDIIDNSKPDFIADAVDNITAKLALIENAKKRNIPIISCMGTGNKLDPSRFRITDISKTSVCPLARIMRRELKARGIESGIPVLWSDEEPRKTNTRTPASISYVPSSAGLMIAGYIIRELFKNCSEKISDFL